MELTRLTPFLQEQIQANKDPSLLRLHLKNCKKLTAIVPDHSNSTKGTTDIDRLTRLNGLRRQPRGTGEVHAPATASDASCGTQPSKIHSVSLGKYWQNALKSEKKEDFWCWWLARPGIDLTMMAMETMNPYESWVFCAEAQKGQSDTEIVVASEPPSTEPKPAEMIFSSDWQWLIWWGLTIFNM